MNIDDLNGFYSEKQLEFINKNKNKQLKRALSNYHLFEENGNLKASEADANFMYFIFKELMKVKRKNEFLEFFFTKDLEKTAYPSLIDELKPMVVPNLYQLMFPMGVRYGMYMPYVPPILKLTYEEKICYNKGVKNFFKSLDKKALFKIHQDLTMDTPYMLYNFTTLSKEDQVDYLITLKDSLDEDGIEEFFDDIYDEGLYHEVLLICHICLEVLDCDSLEELFDVDDEQLEKIQNELYKLSENGFDKEDLEPFIPLLKKDDDRKRPCFKNALTEAMNGDGELAFSFLKYLSNEYFEGDEDFFDYRMFISVDDGDKMLIHMNYVRNIVRILNDESMLQDSFNEHIHLDTVIRLANNTFDDCLNEDVVGIKRELTLFLNIFNVHYSVKKINRLAEDILNAFPKLKNKRNIAIANQTFYSGFYKEAWIDQNHINKEFFKYKNIATLMNIIKIDYSSIYASKTLRYAYLELVEKIYEYYVDTYGEELLDVDYVLDHYGTDLSHDEQEPSDDFVQAAKSVVLRFMAILPNRMLETPYVLNGLFDDEVEQIIDEYVKDLRMNHMEEILDEFLNDPRTNLLETMNFTLAKELLHDPKSLFSLMYKAFFEDHNYSRVNNLVSIAIACFDDIPLLYLSLYVISNDFFDRDHVKFEIMDRLTNDEYMHYAEIESLRFRGINSYDDVVEFIESNHDVRMYCISLYHEFGESITKEDLEMVDYDFDSCEMEVVLEYFSILCVQNKQYKTYLSKIRKESMKDEIQLLCTFLLQVNDINRKIDQTSIKNLVNESKIDSYYEFVSNFKPNKDQFIDESMYQKLITFME